MNDRSSPPEYFERIYAGHEDPWGYGTTAYERGKYAATLAALPRTHFRCGLEIGCSIGVMTRQLAPRCDALLAVDVSHTALARAREACRELTNVTFARLQVPAQWPAGRFDLVVLSEVLYYLARDDVAATAGSVLDTLERNGAVVLVHWLGDTGVARTGDEAAAWFIANVAPPLRVTLRKRTAQYRLDVLAR